MNRGIRLKLLISFVGISLVSLLTVTLLMNLAMSFSFTSYLDNKQKTEVNALVQDLQDSYAAGRGWSPDVLMDVSHYALMRNLEFDLFDNKNELIWSSPDKSNQASKPIVVSLTKGQQKIGTLKVSSSIGQHLEHEQDYLNLFNNLLWLAVAVVLIGAYFFSRYISSGISAPLIRIKETAIKIKEGDLTQRVQAGESSDEVSEVAEALNRLAISLQEQEKLRKNLTADIAHELRTPLAAVRSHLEAFQDGIWQPTPEKIQACRDQIMRLVHLVSDLESLADVENPMLKLKKQSLDLSQVIQHANEAVKEIWTQKKLNVTISANPTVIQGDYQRLLQVFVNLLGNSYKYNVDNGCITVTITEADSHAIVSIKDTGMGIAAEELPYIFERFYRGEKSRNRKTGGAGIGLAIVKAIIEAHGGSVSVTSQFGEGTEFTVSLPK